MRNCWCGNADLLAFSPDYVRCRACGTLVNRKEITPEDLLVSNEDTDLYGKNYWLQNQKDSFGHGDIYVRSRNDLTERNLYWLKTLLKYRLPPAKVLELGCSHGSFVALLRQAGYDASGLELSPWVVEFGRQNFGIPVFVGPLETLDIEPGSLDIIVSMDVLEHLADPVATMRHCLTLLKPDGLLLIQTPQFREEMDYQVLLEDKARFLQMLIPEEHIFLFSENSVMHLFQQLGAEYLQFEPAIFSHYDMFFISSRTPFQVNEPEKIDSTLLASPNGRFCLAMLDLHARESDLTEKLRESEADRMARWEQIEILTQMVHVAEADRAAQKGWVERLKAMLANHDNK